VRRGSVVDIWLADLGSDCRARVQVSASSWPVSSGGRNSSTKGLRGFYPTEALERAIVQFSSDGRQVRAAEEI